jgi:hypothetical protein
MRAWPSTMLRRIITALTAVAVLTCVYLSLHDRSSVPLACMAAYASLGLLFLFIIIAGVQRHFDEMVCHACLFGVCFFPLCVVAKGIGHADVTLRLFVTDSSSNCKIPQVDWSFFGEDRHWEESPWEFVRTVGDTTEYETEDSADIISSIGYFDHTVLWRLLWTKAPLIVITSHERRFRFEPSFLFGHGLGVPKELSANIDMGEYFSGEKKPPPVDEPPDNPPPADPADTD